MLGSMKKLVLCLAFLLVLPGFAEAADTYVSPDGAGTACTESAPCSILTAGNEADANSAIFLGPGDYGSPGDPIGDRIYTFAPNTNYVGQADVRLFVDATASNASVTIYSGQKFLGYGTRIVSADPVGIGIYGSAVAEQVDVRTSAGSTAACQFGNEGTLTGGRLVNSLCVADGFGSIGINLAAGRNDEVATVMASTGVSIGNGGAGISVSNLGSSSGGSGYSQLDVSLSIARADKGYDIDGGFDTPSDLACINTKQTVAISLRPNYCGIAEDNPIRVSASFVDPLNDFHLPAGSNLIDSAKNFSYGIPAVDLDGKPRDPANPDPGAYEFQKPVTDPDPDPGPDPDPPAGTCSVPRLRGLKMPQVRRKLRRANCSLGKVTRKRAAVRKKAGRVLHQSPRAGRVLAAGSPVRVTVGRRGRAGR